MMKPWIRYLNGKKISPCSTIVLVRVLKYVMQCGLIYRKQYGAFCQPKGRCKCCTFLISFFGDPDYADVAGWFQHGRECRCASPWMEIRVIVSTEYWVWLAWSMRSGELLVFRKGDWYTCFALLYYTIVCLKRLKVLPALISKEIRVIKTGIVSTPVLISKDESEQEHRGYIIAVMNAIR